MGAIKVKKEFNKFLGVDVADLNGNGLAEIFVTNHAGPELKSFVLEQSAGQTRFGKVWSNVNLYFRVIQAYGSPPQLLAQRPGFNEPFQPGIFRIHHKNGEYVRGERLKMESYLERETTVYGFARGDTTFDQSIENIVLDKNYNLRVYSSDGKLLVKSDDYYGHDPRLIEVGLKKDYVLGESTNPDRPKPERYKGRLLLVEHHGRRFLLVPKNHRFGGSLLESMVVINNSNVAFLAVNKEGLEKVFETKKQNGYLAAFQVVDAGASRKQVHAAIVSDKGGALKDDKVTTLYIYDWR